jgi:predicted ribosomally synthesized peptide with SipW-like signal peptide
MKNIIKSLVVVAAVAAVASGASYAYFTAQANVTGMTFSTGTMNLSKYPDASDQWMTKVSFSNLKPGDDVRKWVTLENTGTLDIASLKVNAINTSGDTDFLNQLQIAVYGQVNGFDQGIYTPNWGTGVAFSTLTSTDGVNLLGTPVYQNPNTNVANVLSGGEKDTIQIFFRVPTTLDDDYQGKTASFDLQFTGEQSHTGTEYAY